MKDFYFSSVVSSIYVYKFLAMQDSLFEYCINCHLFVLCVDATAYEILKKLELKNVSLIYVSDLEKGKLYKAKKDRSYHEYCWTLKPFFLNYIMQTYRDSRYYAQLDADLYFYSDPVQIINEAPSSSMFLTDHNFSAEFWSSYETSGRFNTGFVCCKKDSTANAAVNWWLDMCYEKCSLVADASKEIYGDQRYVEKWPLLFPNVHIVSSKGANAAQWNVGGYRINGKNGEVYVDDDRLIFYHFSGLEVLSKEEYSLCTFYRIEDSPLKLIYMPYIRNLHKQITLVEDHFPDFRDSYAIRMFAANIHRVDLQSELPES